MLNRLRRKPSAESSPQNNESGHDSSVSTPKNYSFDVHVDLKTDDTVTFAAVAKARAQLRFIKEHEARNPDVDFPQKEKYRRTITSEVFTRTENDTEDLIALEHDKYVIHELIECDDATFLQKVHQRNLEIAAMEKREKSLSSRIRKLSKQALLGANNSYLKAAYRYGTSVDYAQNKLKSLAHPNAPFVEGVDYGKSQYESDEDYQKRMERKGKRAAAASTIGILALGAVAFTARVGGFGDLFDHGNTPSAGHGYAPIPEPSHSGTLPHEYTPDLPIETPDPIDPPSTPGPEPPIEQPFSRSDLFDKDGSITKAAEKEFFTSIDGHTVKSDESVTSLSSDFLEKYGVNDDVSAETELKNAFLEQHPDQVGVNNWLDVNQVIETR